MKRAFWTFVTVAAMGLGTTAAAAASFKTETTQYQSHKKQKGTSKHKTLHVASLNRQAQKATTSSQQPGKSSKKQSTTHEKKASGQKKQPSQHSSLSRVQRRHM